MNAKLFWDVAATTTTDKGFRIHLTYSHTHTRIYVYIEYICLSVCLQRVHATLVLRWPVLNTKVLTHRSSAATSLKLSLAYQLDWTRT